MSAQLIDGKAIAQAIRAHTKQAAAKLLLTHFQREERHTFFRLYRHVAHNVQGETGFTHTGTSRQQNQVGAVQSGDALV